MRARRLECKRRRLSKGRIVLDDEERFSRGGVMHEGQQEVDMVLCVCCVMNNL